MIANALLRYPDLQVNNISALDIAKELSQEVKEALQDDPEFSCILSALWKPEEPHQIPTSYLWHFEVQNKLLYFDQERLCILKDPLWVEVLYESHNTDIARHQGTEHTYER